jgi:hypothetical protein
MTADRLRTVPGSLAGWLARSLGVANDRANAYCARREHESGFLRVEDAYGLAAKCPGMALGLELRMVAGKRVGGLPQTMLKSVVQTAASPVEMVFIVPDGTCGIDVAAPLLCATASLYCLLCTTATPRILRGAGAFVTPLNAFFCLSSLTCFVALILCFPVSLLLTLHAAPHLTCVFPRHRVPFSSLSSIRLFAAPATLVRLHALLDPWVRFDSSRL